MALDIYVNDEKLDLSAEAVIALTKQVADLKAFTVIKSSFSNTITVPITDTNRRVLENSQVVVSTTELPYLRIPVSVFQDGVQLIAYGYGVIDEAGESFKLVVYDGNIDWTTALGTLRLEDMDTTDAVHEWDLATIIDSHTFPGKIVYSYPPVVGGLYDPTAVDFMQSFVPPDLFNIAYLRPYMFMSQVLERIFDQIGYQIEGDILSDTRYTRAVVECSRFDWSRKWYVGRYIANTMSHLSSRAQTGSGVRFGYLQFIDDTNDVLANASLGFKVFDQLTSPIAEPYTNFNNLNKPGRYRLKLTLNLNVLGSVQVLGNFYPASSVQYVLNSTYPMTLVQGYTNLINNNTTTVLEVDIEIPELLTSGFQRFWLNSTAPNPSSVVDKFDFNLLAGSKLEVVDWFGSGTFTYGDVVNLAFNLPDMSMVDYVRALCNMFGVAPVGDPVDKKVRLVAWNDLEALKPYALDWSAKFDTSKPAPIKPRLEGWARKNNFTYTPDPEGFVAGGFGDGYKLIADEWLPEKRAAVTLPWAATQTNEQGWPFVLRSLTDYDPTNPQRDTHFDREGPARVLIVDWNPGSINIAMPSTGVPIITTLTNYQRGYFISSTDQGLDWEGNLLPDYYGFVDSFIAQPKLVTCELMLTPVDVQQFSPFVPVYISKFSSYFFVNKINNWVKGKTCKVELIRI